MNFTNQTPFPAQAFTGVDQHDQSFHVIALRQTLTWNAAGELTFTNEQTPLCEEDEPFDGNPHASVRQESDLCHYKPRCDVIVNATAHAPKPRKNRPVTHFETRLTVRRDRAAPPLPPMPEGLNPLMAPSPARMAEWHAEVARLNRESKPASALIDKTLVIIGKRQFEKRSRLFLLPYWRLTRPRPLSSLPVRLEHSFGGQCRIEPDTPAAKKVPRAHVLDEAQRAAHPDRNNPPIAHDAYALNPLGCGFSRDWHLRATSVASIPAPQIETPAHPVSKEMFDLIRKGKPGDTSTLVAGFGVRPKGHPDRAKLAGTIDDKFIQSDAALPNDFDFAVWNAAWPDQQVAALEADETIELTNLCAHNTPAACQDERGNTLLRLALPGNTAHVLIRLLSGEVFLHPMRLDTVIVEPDDLMVSLVWRSVLAQDPGVPIRAVETHTLSAKERQAFNEKVTRYERLMAEEMPTDRDKVPHG